jgi:hypothetical protein
MSPPGAVTGQRSGSVPEARRPYPDVPLASASIHHPDCPDPGIEVDIQDRAPAPVHPLFMNDLVHGAAVIIVAWLTRRTLRGEGYGIVTGA